MHAISSHNVPFLMVEESDVLFHEDDAKLLGCLVDSTVILTTARGSDILGTRSVRAVDVVYEGELDNKISRLLDIV